MKWMLENEWAEVNWIKILYNGGLSVNMVLILREISGNVFLNCIISLAQELCAYSHFHIRRRKLLSTKSCSICE
jgi:hypothetical protein